MNAQGAVALPSVIDVESIQNFLASQLTGQRLRDAQTFAREFLRRLSPEDLAARSATEWAALINGALDFARERRAGHAKLRVFMPNVADNGYESARSIIEIVTDDMPFLVDSVGLRVSQAGLQLHTVIHPFFRVARSTLEDGEEFLHDIDLHSMKYAEVYRGADALRRLLSSFNPLSSWQSTSIPNRGRRTTRRIGT